MKTENGPPPPAVEDELTALIATLHETEQRLEELTGGEVDTVSDRFGRPYVLRRAQEEWRDREADKQAAILNALPAHIALLDPEGVIVSVNETWRRFATANFLQGPPFGIGVNYLDVCDRTTGSEASDAHRVADGIRAVLAGEKSFSFEYPCHAPTEQRWFQMTATPLTGGQAHGAVVMHLNITERRRIDDALRATKKRQRDLIDGLGATMMVGLMTPDGILVEANAPALAAVGLKAEEVLGKPLVDSRWFTYSANIQQQLREAIARGVRGEASRYDMQILGTDGQLIDIDFSLNPVRGETGEVAFLVPSGNVITDRKRAELAMRESNEKFHQLADNISDAFWIRSPDMSEVQYVSPAFERIWGRSVASLQANPHQWVDFILAEDRERVVAAFAGLTAGASGLDIEYRIVRPAGEIRWVRVRGFQIRNEADQLIRHIGIVADITERKQAETELQWKTAFLEAQVASSIDGILVVDHRGKKALQNQRMTDLFEIPPDLANDPNDEAQLRWVTDRTKDPAQFGANVAFLNAHRSEVSRDEIELKNGTTLDRYSSPVVGKDGEYYGRIWTFRDVTDRRRSLEALRASEKHFKAIFEQAAVGVAQADAATGRLVQVNQRFCEIVGRRREELLQLTFADITHPHDVAHGLDVERQMQAGALRESSTEKRYLRKDGTEVWAEVTVSPMWVPGDKPDLLVAIVQDVTARRKMEEHIQQAQKMEAVGTLAGGIAHDFNNILAAINGYTELSRMVLKENPEVHEYLTAVLQASSRATDLIRQILAFSRQQRPERRPITLRPIVVESLKLLRATLPTTIEFEIILEPDTPVVLADATQIHQVLMNLGTNAWHAMKERPGRLHVTLEKWMVDAALAAMQPKLQPGAYARLSVGDTGEGMDASTLRRIFEPFFTTKPPGEGTGLGLAVVHGIMDSHDGAITVQSRPGEGTVFRLYFPAHAGEVAALAPQENPVLRGHGERLLVVDDEEVITRLIKKSLGEIGYEVEVATESTVALAMVRANPTHFALVITDQTMPGMTGLLLATQLRHLRSDLPVILMTGYSPSLTAERIKAAGIQRLLFKPMSMSALAAAVRTALTVQPTC